MMYSIVVDGLMVHGGEHVALNPKVSLVAGMAGSCSFTLMHDHPDWGNVHKLSSIVRVYRGSKQIFAGRVVNDELDLYNRRTVTAEGFLAYFNDSILRPYIHQGTISEYLQLILDQHNSQVEADKQFTLGDVTVTDPNNYIARSDSTYPIAWDSLQEKLVRSLGGYFFARESGGVLYLDYLEDSTYMSQQIITTEDNLLDIQQDRQGVDIATAIIPLGVADEETGDRLNIADINEGVDYVYDQSAVDKYGWIFRTEIWEDVTVASNLKTKAQQKLAELVGTDISITVRAADLSHTNSLIDDFGIFEYVTVDSPVHGIQDDFLVLKQDIDLNHPAGNAMVLGKRLRSFTETEASVANAVRSIRADYLTNTQLQLVKTMMKTYESLIQQTAESITLEVTERTEIVNGLLTELETLSTSLEQTSTSFDFNFSNLSTSVSNLSGSTNTKFTNIEKYIRFVGGKIIIGETASDLKVEISNNELAFFDGGAKVAYITEQALYINSAIIVDNLQVGNHRMKRWGTSNTYTIFEFAGG